MRKVHQAMVQKSIHLKTGEKLGSWQETKRTGGRITNCKKQRNKTGGLTKGDGKEPAVLRKKRVAPNAVLKWRLLRGRTHELKPERYNEKNHNIITLTDNWKVKSGCP